MVPLVSENARGRDEKQGLKKFFKRMKINNQN